MEHQKATAATLSISNRIASIYARVVASPRFATVLLASIVVAEFCLQLFKARRRPFWYDELLTWHVSRLQPFSLFWDAIQASVDSMPPGYYAFVRLANMLPGDAHVTLRAPSVLGYVLCLLGVYWFARKSLPEWGGPLALVLTMLTPFRDYAIEARAYSLEVGFLAVAAACWQRIGERRMMTPLFALFLALAVFVYPLAVVAVFCFGIAELSFTLVSRRVRWGTSIACVLAGCAIDLPQLLRGRRIYGGTFWARAAWSDILGAYASYLGLNVGLTVGLLVFFVIMAGGGLLRARRTPVVVSRERNFSQPEIVLIGALALYPALVFVPMKILTASFIPRYGWPGVLGLVLGAVYLIFRVIRPGPAPARLTIALMVTFVGLHVHELTLLTDSTGRDGLWQKLTLISRDEPGLPIVLSGFHGRALLLDEDRPAELEGRIVTVVDPESAFRLAGQDTLDRELSLMAQFMPLHVEFLAPFLEGHQRFVLSTTTGDDWFFLYLLENKYKMRLVSPNYDCLLFIVER